MSKSRLEIVADTLKQPSEEMTVLLTAGDKETTNVLYFKVMRVVLSGLPLPVVSVELCRQAGTSFLENIWDTLSRLRTKMEEQESRIRRQETINQELQRVLELTREEKDKIEKRLLTKFMRLLNEKKRKIQQLEQSHHNTNDRCPKA